MRLKLDEAGHVVVSDGKPVYVKDDGSEVAFDVAGTVATISRLNGEAKGHRERAEAAEKSLKAFDGISDPALARKAMETYANIDAKKLIDAGEVERVKSQIATAYEEKLTAAEKRAQELEASLYNEMIGGAFAKSPFINGEEAKVVIPADLMQARFGSAFKIEDGRVVAYDANGQKIYSRANPGELAGFDESIEILVSNYPHKANILRGAGGVGSNSTPSNAPIKGQKVITTAQLNAMAPKEQAAFMASGGTLSD